MNELITLKAELAKILTSDLGFGRDAFSIHEKNRAAVLALFRGSRFLDSEILLILRSPGLMQNPGQVALPGGGVEALDEGNAIQTALRETFEEVGLTPSSIEALGLLPSLSTVTGQFVVEPVVGLWNGTGDAILTLQESEVAHAEWVKVSTLFASRTLEKRMVHGVEMELPVFLWGEQRMWGLTAMIFDLILRRYDKLFS